MAITNNRLDWQIDINVFMTPISHVNFNTNTGDNGSVRNGYRTSSGAQNDEISFDLILAAGTWTVELLHFQATDAGVYSVQLDAVEKGTIDGYVAVAARNVRSSVTGITVTKAQKYRLTLKMATKNASSSNYYGRINHIQLRRTA